MAKSAPCVAKKMRDGDYAEYNGGRYTVKVEE